MGRGEETGQPWRSLGEKFAKRRVGKGARGDFCVAAVETTRMTDEIFHSRCCGGRPRGEGACRPAWGDGRVEDKAISVPRLPRVLG